jgi:hypothetical protein
MKVFGKYYWISIAVITPTGMGEVKTVMGKRFFNI